MKVTLRECPPGLFRHGDTLGFKSEYLISNEKPFPEAFVVASGEFYWGGAKTHEDRQALLVEPLYCPPSGDLEAMTDDDLKEWSE